MLSSLPPQDWAPWVHLPRDDRGGTAGAAAHGRLHYAPTDNRGHRDRMAAIADWAARTSAAAAVVDVSVEVAVLLRTLGVPTTVLAMPGRRTDAPHRLGYDLADRIVAPWPGELYRPAWLERYGDRVSYVGGISRHTVASGPGRRTGSDGTRRVVLVGGAGGSELTAADLTAARDATPGWSWTVAGPLGEWHADVETLLRDADVAVIAAGQNSVADVAAAGCRAVVVPQPRPYDEQRTTARVLARAGLAVVRERWPQAHEWPQVLDRAAGLDSHWERWQVAGAARRAAQAVIGLCA